MDTESYQCDSIEENENRAIICARSIRISGKQSVRRRQYLWMKERSTTADWVVRVKK